MTCIGCRNIWAWHQQKGRSRIESLIESLVGHYECGAGDCLANFTATEAEPNFLHGDALAEAVFNGLDACDKKEFEDYGEAIQKR